MGRPFVSRHFLGEQPAAAALAAVPFAAPGAADERGVALAHNLLALGSWSQEAQEARLTLFDLAVSHRGDEIAAQPAISRLASFQHSGRVAALEVADVGSGSGVLLLLTASTDGSVSRLRLQVPTQPGSQPEAVQLRGEGEDFDGLALIPWLDCHAAAVTALCANTATDQPELLSAAADGTLVLTPLAAPDRGSSRQLYSCGGALTFTSARWSGPHTAVTGSLQGLLHVWDRRQDGRPALQLQQPRPAGAPAAQMAAPPPAGITCLDVHPAQHYCCATGGADGSVAVWDLRRASSSSSSSSGWQQQLPGGDSASVACCSLAAAGGGSAGAAAVLDLRFEGASSIGSGSQRLVFCTSGGAIGVLRDAAAAGSARLLFQEPTAAVQACCLGSAGGACSSQLFCTTDQEGLVYLASAL